MSEKKLTQPIRSFLSKISWKIVGLIVVAIIVALTLGLGSKWILGGLGAVLAALGLRRKGPNSRPWGRSENLGEEDEHGFVQIDQTLTDDPAAILKDDEFPTGIDDDDIELVIETDPSINIEMIPDDAPEPEKASIDILEEYLKKKGAID